MSSLISELASAAAAEKKLEFDGAMEERLCAYSRAVAHFPTAVKEVKVIHSHVTSRRAFFFSIYCFILFFFFMLSLEEFTILFLLWIIYFTLNFLLSVQMEEWLVLFSFRKGDCRRTTRSMPSAYGVAQTIEDYLKDETL